MDFQEIIDELKDRRGSRLDIETIISMMLVVMDEMDRDVETLENEVALLKEQLKYTGKE